MNRLIKVALFLVSILAFILAVMLMKEGAYALAPLMQNHLAISNPLHGLGYGWLFAYLIMSGSPVAAAALVFLDVGAIDVLASYMMVTGSRLGASFIVFFLGFLYVLRGRSRATSLGMGMLSLSVTGTTYLVGMVIGLLLLRAQVFDGIRLGRAPALETLIDLLFDPVVHAVAEVLPTWLLFPLGLMVVMASFALFDRCLPQMTVRDSHVGQVSRLVYQPWVMFVLGAAITLISMSVSVTLGLLVPLSARGFIRRENVIPYIMGANVTTFVDTLLVAILLGNAQAVSVVLASMTGIVIVSTLILATSYRRYEHAMLAMVSWSTASNRNMTLFTAVILVVPLLLILI